MMLLASLPKMELSDGCFGDEVVLESAEDLKNYSRNP